MDRHIPVFRQEDYNNAERMFLKPVEASSPRTPISSTTPNAPLWKWESGDQGHPYYEKDVELNPVKKDRLFELGIPYYKST
ncbi:MAG: hypothetical protein IPI66_15470 [Chitinophagaceae bacterium]|nr:hypothetical protein [Chitinophagaceae bacterium]